MERQVRPGNGSLKSRPEESLLPRLDLSLVFLPHLLPQSQLIVLWTGYYVSVLTIEKLGRKWIQIQGFLMAALFRECSHPVSSEQ